MNHWTELSVELANNKDYLDLLYEVYPVAPNPRRNIPKSKVAQIKAAFDSGNNAELILHLLDLDLFPIKDSFVAYLKRDKASIARNPKTVDRISDTLHKMGFDEMMERCTEPKEQNRQMGPMFKQWIDKGLLGAPVFKDGTLFFNNNGNCIFNSSDAEMKAFAIKHFGFDRNKGIDFIGKFNDKYVIAETKFLTDFGGHQNAQFDDAVKTMEADFSHKTVPNDVIPICIMDGVLFIKGNNKMYKYLLDHSDQIIISALLLKDFLHSL